MTVLITGGSRGIGEAIAHRLAAQQNDLILIARDKEELRRTAEKIREKYGVTVTAISADLTKPGMSEKLRTQFAKNDTAITGLVNNAGFGYRGNVKDMGGEAESMIALNVTILTELTRAFLPSIEKADGFVINIASVAGMVPVPSMAVYAATKSYVIAFSESLSLETSARVLCICPGPVETKFHERANTSFGPGKSADQVALETMHALKSGAIIHVSDPKLRWLLRLTGWMPRAWVRTLSRMMMRERS